MYLLHSEVVMGDGKHRHSLLPMRLRLLSKGSATVEDIRCNGPCNGPCRAPGAKAGVHLQPPLHPRGGEGGGYQPATTIGRE